jgi:hypothetical protein
MLMFPSKMTLARTTSGCMTDFGVPSRQSWDYQTLSF